jgi:hypothetical protein
MDAGDADFGQKPSIANDPAFIAANRFNVGNNRAADPSRKDIGRDRTCVALLNPSPSNAPYVILRIAWLRPSGRCGVAVLSDFAFFEEAACRRSRCGFSDARRERRPSWPVIASRAVVLFSALSLLMPPTANAGPEVSSCPAGSSPRRALPTDGVCVNPQSRSRVAAENARAPLLWLPGPFGPKTCATGYVWREATPVDFTCVTPDIRTLVRSEKANPHLPAGQ